MATLTKMIYGYGCDPKKAPFGLSNNQVRGDDIIRNAGWFNMQGDYLGRGDLSLKDLHTIAKGIPATEAFFALSEAASSWDLPSHLDQTSPGFPYVIQKALWVVIQTANAGVVIRVRDDIEKGEVNNDGKYLRVPRKEMFAAFKYDVSGNPIPAAPKKEVLKVKADSKVDTGSKTMMVKKKSSPLSSLSKSTQKTIAATKNPASIKSPPAPTKVNNPGIGSGPSLTLPPKTVRIKINPVP